MLNSARILFWTLLLQTQFAQASLRELADRENSVNYLADAYYRYKEIRDNKFLGEKGINKKTKLFINDTQKWLQNWQQTSQDFGKEQENILAISSQVSGFIRQQQTDFVQIKSSADSLRRELGEIQKKLKRVDTVKLSGPLNPQAEKLFSLRDELLQLAVSIDEKTQYELDRMTALQEVFSYDFFIRRLQKIAIEKSIAENSPLLLEARQMIHAEILGSPSMIALERQAQTEIHRMQRFEVFALKKSLPSFNQTCQTTQNRIPQLGLSTEQQQRLQNEARKICADVEQRFQKSIAIYPDLDLVEMHNKTRLKSYRRYCEKPQKSIRCDIYQKMAAISREALSHYDQNSLVTVEQAWKIFEESIP